MRQKVMQDIRGDAIVARDGKVGSVADVYFDDERWAVRYLVVDTGGWLPGRKILISPAQVPPQDAGDAIRVELTREQVEQAPGIEQDAPVSRTLEAAHARYYRYPYYWTGPYLWGATPLPAAQPGPPTQYRELEAAAEQQARESHLRSSGEVVGYNIRAADGDLGHVEDFVIDDETWAISDMVVDTRNWLPGRKVLVPPSAIEDIDWATRKVSVRMKRDELKQAPEAR